MTPDEILSIQPKVLTQKQRQRYFEDGFILLERFLSEDWIARLRAVTERMVEESRQVTERDEKWDIEPDHTAAQPRLRRLSSPNDHDPVYWDYAAGESSNLPDAIADLVGPDVKFHHSKLNFKGAKGGAEVKWQDAPSPPARHRSRAQRDRACQRRHRSRVPDYFPRHSRRCSPEEASPGCDQPSIKRFMRAPAHNAPLIP